MSQFFVDVGALPWSVFGFVQLLYLSATYVFLLKVGSLSISEGAEMLLLTKYAGVVGCLILPVVSTLPDALLIIASGWGPDAKEQLNVGIGALAGSTIVLLTLPWSFSIFLGRVDLAPLPLDRSELEAERSDESMRLAPRYLAKPKLSFTHPNDQLTRSAVAISPHVRRNSWMMMLTTVGYLFLQIPATVRATRDKRLVTQDKWAIWGIANCAIWLVVYIWYQVHVAEAEEEGSQLSRRENAIKQSISKGEISLVGALVSSINPETLSATRLSSASNESSPLVQQASSDEEVKALRRIKNIVRPIFQRYDISRDGALDIEEFASVMRDLHEYRLSKEHGGRGIHELFSLFDTNKSGYITFHEFTLGMIMYMQRYNDLKKFYSPSKFLSPEPSAQTEDSEEEQIAEQEKMEEEEQNNFGDLQDLTPDEQQVQITYAAAKRLLLGSLLLLVFSSPLVDCLDELGTRTGVDSFYVSFLIAPFVANIPELVACYQQAKKKTQDSIATCFATLQGSVSMNNTLALGIFLILLCAQDLIWRFTAETLVIILVEVFCGTMTLRRRYFTLFDGLLFLGVYPISIILVYILKKLGL